VESVEDGVQTIVFSLVAATSDHDAAVCPILPLTQP
jgi:hypothetical protein